MNNSIISVLLPCGSARRNLALLLRDMILSIKFKRQFKRYASILANERFACNWKDKRPCLNDATGTTRFDAHYIYHPAWAARILAKTMPLKHIDISSKLDFVTLASAFIPVEFYDYRPANLVLSGLCCKKADLTALPFADNSVESLSCMHVVEHIGLGRYGDPIDPAGDLKASRELSRVLAKGGQLLFVVPIGEKAIIQFNAHRIYTFEMIMEQFSELEIRNFALVTDSGEYFENATQQQANMQKYGCGCFLLKK